MLRINLLPPYIYDKQKKIKWIVTSLALIPLTLVLLLAWAKTAQDAVDKATQERADAQAQQDLYNKAVADIKLEDDTVAATRSKQEFIANSIKYNASWPQAYSTMRDLTSPKILLHGMYVSDDRTAINFSGWCQYEEDLVRWWMFLRTQQDVYSDVHFKLPEHPWPPKSESAGNAGGGGMGMMGGSMGGGMAGSPGMLGGAGSPSIAGMGGSSGMGGSAGPGSFGGGGGNSDAVGPEEIEGKRGIKFTAVATLKKPLAGGIQTPTWATAGGSSNGGGGPSMGGPMGGSGGPGAGFGTMTPPGGKGKMGGM